VLGARRPRIAPPTPAAYVAHMQDLLTHGIAADRRDAHGVRRDGRRRG